MESRSRTRSSPGIPTQLDRYELREQLGRGGMATIHRALDGFTRREVAYKQLLISDERSRARLTNLFQREYETLARLQHPNIVGVHDYGVNAHGPYYTMELLTGDDLTKLAPLPFREGCKVLRDIASALSLVHARRLIHRDVSPANVRLTRDGRVKLMDFGALMPFGKAKELVGTPACMAPESLTESPLDQRSDLYSFGALAYWTLTRHMAVQARSLDQLPQALAAPLLAPSMYVPDLPKELDELLLSLLAHDPLARPASAAYVIERLTSIAGLAPESDERRVAYGYLAHPPLVGRSEQLAALAMVREAAQAGRGAAVMVEGAPGLGRSALLDELTLSGQLAGATVIRLDPEPGSGPFALARRVVRELTMLYPDLEERVSARASFQSFYPDGLKPAQARSAMQMAERHAEVVNAVQSTVLAAASYAPIILVIDDVHLVDDESLSALAALAHSLSSHALMLVMSAPLRNASELSPTLAKLAERAHRLQLGALQESEVLDLVTSIFGTVPNHVRFGQWLRANSGGNPGTIMDLTRLLLMRGAIRYTVGTFTLPHDASADLSEDDLANACLARLGDLGEHARSLATVLSLHDRPLRLAVLERASALDPIDLASALEELTSRELALLSEGSVSLTSATVAAGLRRTLDAERQASLHERIARAFLGAGGTELSNRILAAGHLLEARLEDEAADVLTRTHGLLTMEGPEVSHYAPTLERVLAVYRRQKRRKERCLTVLVPLTRAGFYGDFSSQRRNFDLCMSWMGLVCGITIARKLKPYCGGKLALVLGILYGSIRRAFVPKYDRIGTLKEILAEFVGTAAASVAAAASALDGEAARRIVARIEPLSVLKPETPAGLMYQFCLATAEVAMSDMASSVRRYRMLMPILKRPVPGIEEGLRNGLYNGCLNGCAQAAVTSQSDGVLELAEELAKDTFFAPHAECARMTYYAYRGESEKAQEHRARAELLALRGGTSWSAMTVLSVRMTYAAIFNNDPILLVQAITELERFSAIAPRLGLTKQIAEAWLEHLRGRSERAVGILAPLVDTEEARSLASSPVDRALYAATLNATGQHQLAREVCLGVLGSEPDFCSGLYSGAVRGLALAEAALGELQRAAEILDRQIAAVEPSGNPLMLGAAHLDRARVAMMARDRETFDRHFAQLQRCFLGTKNPVLIAQIDLFQSEAQRSGISAPGRIVHSSSAGTAPRDEEFEGETVIEEAPTVERSKAASGE